MLAEGNTIDLYVSSLALSFENHLNAKAEKGHSVNSPDQQTLQNMLDTVRNKKKNNDSKSS